MTNIEEQVELRTSAIFYKIDKYIEWCEKDIVCGVDIEDVLFDLLKNINRLKEAYLGEEK